ncbi:MAG: hypothetical protein R3B40_11100 [Polyangiales bacterium]|nr:hypothetical protein [Myxococcales bacterium]MCB9658000.1 hypothetical protein [Sandaracinaceae bacterium]
MSRDRSADIHMKDGILRRGRKVGHADAKGRIRERDTRFKKGRELGYVDDKQRVRRRRGRLGQRGEVVARIRGNAVYARDTVLSAGHKLGYVDERGNVWQVDCQAFRGRIIGRARGADPESALAYFVLKFEDVATHVEVLEEKIRASEDQFAFLPRVRATRQLLPEVDALGDFDALFEKLDDLEELCVVGLGDHFTAEGGLGRLLTDGVTIDGLRSELVSLLGGERRNQIDALLYRARGAVDAISDGRIPTLADFEGPPEPEPPAPEPDMEPERARLGRSLVSLDRLRSELLRISQDPTAPAEELLERARRTIGSYLESGDEPRRNSTLPPPPGERSERPERSERGSVRPAALIAGVRAHQVREVVEQRLDEVRAFQRTQGDRVLEWKDRIERIALGDDDEDGDGYERE